MSRPLLVLLCLIFFLGPLWAEEVLYHRVKPGETLEKIAESYGVKVSDLKKWNHLKTQKVRAGQRLVIKRSEKKGKVKETEGSYHLVKKGEKLAQIAAKYGVTVEDLKEWNNLKGDKVLAGQKLLIKKEKKAPSTSGPEGVQVERRIERENATTTSTIYHKVKKGETLEKIASLYGVSQEDLKRWNRLKKNRVYPGQRLLIQKEASQEAKEREKGKGRPKEIIYRVKSGETLTDIARLFGVAEEDLIKTNHLKTKELKPGQKLLIRITEEPPKEITNLKEAFEALEKEEKALRKKGLTRKDYLRLISQYRNLYLLYPASEVAPLSLLRTGELYLELYHQSLRKSDALEAAKRFELFLKNYRERPEKERVYLSLLEIYEREVKDLKKAEEIKSIWGKDLEKTKKTKEVEREKVLAKSQKMETKEPVNETNGIRKRPPEIGPVLKKVQKIEPVTGEDYTRIIIDLSDDFEYFLNILPKKEDKPARLYVDLYPAQLEKDLPRVIDLKDKHLEAIRAGQFDTQTVRVVLDLKSLTDYKVFKLKNPHQLIIDLIGKEKKPLAKASPSKEKGKKAPSVKSEQSGTSPRQTHTEKAEKTERDQKNSQKTSYINLARQLGLGVKRIMLDPGHGGEDPGALGPNGLKEKDVVLKLAKLLGKKLEERLGVEVIFTRDEDVFIPLAKRPALANSRKADLFVSLHLNASPDPKARGIETYYLNFTTDPEAMRVAALENRANNQGLADLQDLVKAVLVNTKLNESRELANKVQRELVRHLGRFYPEVEDRGVKYAPFLVLVGTRMPAILVESDFITNPVSAKRLLEEDYLDKIAEGIAKGIEVYVQSLKLSQVQAP